MEISQYKYSSVTFQYFTWIKQALETKVGIKEYISLIMSVLDQDYGLASSLLGEYSACEVLAVLTLHETRTKPRQKWPGISSLSK